MKKQTQTVAPASEGTPANTAFTHEVKVSVIDGFERTAYVAPALPPADWDTLYSGVCMDRNNQPGIAHQLVLQGDTLVVPRDALLCIHMTVDDIGDLLISSTAMES